MTTQLTYDLDDVADQISEKYAILRRGAEMFFDAQKTRVAMNNRLGSGDVFPARYGFAVEELKTVEEGLSRALVRAYMETVPAGVIEWAQRTSGIGRSGNPHLLARLLGHLGHPRLAVPKYWTTEFAEENGDGPQRELAVGDPYLRSISQLWQYCGHGNPEDRRREGMTQEEYLRMGSPICKMLVNLMAKQVNKAQVLRGEPTGSLGALFLETKERYRERVHSGPCPGGNTKVGERVRRVRCKVDGRYAVAGDPFQPSHVNAIALRRVGKEILRELWIAAEEPWAVS